MQGHCGNQLCHHIRLRVAEIQRTAHITNCATGCHSTEGSDLRHMVGTVLLHNILNDLTTALLAEVRIEVGHADTLGVEEALKNQRVFHGIHFRDMHTVCHNGSRTGATARAHRNPLFFCVANKIPDNEIVIYISHPADNANLIFQPIHIFRRCVGITLPEAIHTELAEILFIGITFGHRERG